MLVTWPQFRTIIWHLVLKLYAAWLRVIKWSYANTPCRMYPADTWRNIVIMSYCAQTTSQRRFDVIMILLLRRVSTGYYNRGHACIHAVHIDTGRTTKAITWFIGVVLLWVKSRAYGGDKASTESKVIAGYRNQMTVCIPMHTGNGTNVEIEFP